MRPRPPVALPTPAIQNMPSVNRPGGFGNRASLLEPTPYLSQNQFRTLIGEVGTPNDYVVPLFTTSFKITPLGPNVPGKGTLSTRDALAEPDFFSEIVGAAAIINAASRMSPSYSTPDGIGAGGAEITINALRGEVYAVDCLTDVNEDPNATVYYRTSDPMGTGPILPEMTATLKNYHFVTLVKRANQNGEIKIFLRPQNMILPSSGLGGLGLSNVGGGMVEGLEGLRRAALTPEERAAEDAAKAAQPPPPPPARYTMKLWGCQVSSAN